MFNPYGGTLYFVNNDLTLIDFTSVLMTQAATLDFILKDLLISLS